jgi:hypothetical protein
MEAAGQMVDIIQKAGSIMLQMQDGFVAVIRHPQQLWPGAYAYYCVGPTEVAQHS